MTMPVFEWHPEPFPHKSNVKEKYLMVFIYVENGPKPKMSRKSSACKLNFYTCDVANITNGCIPCDL